MSPEPRLIKFEEIYSRTRRGALYQSEAAEILGVSERTFRRWRDRYEAEGAEGLYDRRLGRISARRAPADGVARVLSLFDTRYWDFTARHFHEKLVADHGCERSYNWVRLTFSDGVHQPMVDTIDLRTIPSETEASNRHAARPVTPNAYDSSSVHDCECVRTSDESRMSRHCLSAGFVAWRLRSVYGHLASIGLGIRPDLTMVRQLQ